MSSRSIFCILIFFIFIPCLDANEAGTSPTSLSQPQSSTASPSLLPVEVNDAEELNKRLSQEQIDILVQFENPKELIDYFQRCIWRRNYIDAIGCIHFGETVLSLRSKRQVASNLSIILDRLELDNLGDFPVSGDAFVQRFQSAKGPVEIEFIRNKNDCWLFFVDEINVIQSEFELLRDEPVARIRWLTDYFPDWSYMEVVGIPFYRIVLVVIIFVLAILIKFLLQWGLYFISHHILRKLIVDWKKEYVRPKFWSPLGWIVLATFWYIGIAIIVQTESVREYFHFVYLVFCIVMSVRMVFRCIALFSLWLRQQVRRRDARLDDIFIPLFSRTSKLLILCVGLIALAHVLGWPILGLVSGMGIGGVAIAFAAKETIGNFFGSLTVVFDKPFRIGDWVVTNGIEGTVESVGMRSTRIRTFY
ncbi:MAG: mechanosensitive ion channel family protein, partial [Thermoguttaceae bacterium]